MKHWLWILLAFFAVVCFSGKGKGTDVARLQPVQVVSVSREDGQVHLETDMGDLGAGTDTEAALEDMKASSPAEIFLDTAEFLLVAPDCEDLIPDLMDRLRPACMVCIREGEADLELAGGYLRTHPPKTTLMDLRAGGTGLQTLWSEEGRMELVP